MNKQTVKSRLLKLKALADASNFSNSFVPMVGHANFGLLKSRLNDIDLLIDQITSSNFSRSDWMRYCNMWYTILKNRE